MLRESGVVDAGGYGLVLILAGVVAGLRGDAAPAPEIAHHDAPTLSRPHHEDSRYRYCTNFIVSGSGLAARDFLPRLEGLGDSVLVVGDEATLKVHVHTDEPEDAVALFEGAGRVTNLDVADMREQIAERQARLKGGRTGVVAVAAGEGLERLFAELGAHVVPGGETLNPSTYELLAGIHEVPAEEVLVLPSSSNVIMAAERACELSEKPARVIQATSQQAGLLALVEHDPEAHGRRERRATDRGAGGDRLRRRRPGRARRRPGPLPQGRRGRLRRRRDRRLGRRRLDPGEDGRAARRRGGDRHRAGRQGRPDPARGDRHPRPRRGRDRDPRRRPAELVVAISGPVARSFAGGAELSREQLLGAPVHWPRPSVLDVSLEALEGVGPKLAEAAKEAGIGSVGDLLLRFPHSHRDRTIVPVAGLEPNAQATIRVEVLADASRPFRKRGLSILTVKVGDDSGSVRATWFNQPWLAQKMKAGTRLLLTGSRDKRGFRVSEYEVVGEGEDVPPAGWVFRQESGAVVPEGGRGEKEDAAAPGGHPDPPSRRLVAVHPATEQLKAQRIRQWVEQAMQWVGNVPEPLPAELRMRRELGRSRRCRQGDAFPGGPGGSRAGAGAAGV